MTRNGFQKPMFSSFLQVRTADASDLVLLDGLARAHDYREPDYFTRCLNERDAGRRRIFVAETPDKQGAGYVMLNRLSRYQPFRSLKVPEIQDLFVRPEYRRQGTGRALIDACEQAARHEQNTMIGLAVGLHAAYGAAQRLYVRMGYLPDGFGIVHDCEPVKPGEYRPVDDHLCLMMVKDLQDGNSPGLLQPV